MGKRTVSEVDARSRIGDELYRRNRDRAIDSCCRFAQKMNAFGLLGRGATEFEYFGCSGLVSELQENSPQNSPSTFSVSVQRPIPFFGAVGLANAR